MAGGGHCPRQIVLALIFSFFSSYMCLSCPQPENKYYKAYSNRTIDFSDLPELPCDFVNGKPILSYIVTSRKGLHLALNAAASLWLHSMNGVLFICDDEDACMELDKLGLPNYYPKSILNVTLPSVAYKGKGHDVELNARSLKYYGKTFEIRTVLYGYFMAEGINQMVVDYDVVYLNDPRRVFLHPGYDMVLECNPCPKRRTDFWCMQGFVDGSNCDSNKCRGHIVINNGIMRIDSTPSTRNFTLLVMKAYSTAFKYKDGWMWVQTKFAETMRDTLPSLMPETWMCADKVMPSVHYDPNTSHKWLGKSVFQDVRVLGFSTWANVMQQKTSLMHAVGFHVSKKGKPYTNSADNKMSAMKKAGTFYLRLDNDWEHYIGIRNYSSPSNRHPCRTDDYRKYARRAIDNQGLVPDDMETNCIYARLTNFTVHHTWLQYFNKVIAQCNATSYSYPPL